MTTRQRHFIEPVVVSASFSDPRTAAFIMSRAVIPADAITATQSGHTTM